MQQRGVGRIDDGVVLIKGLLLVASFIQTNIRSCEAFEAVLVDVGLTGKDRIVIIEGCLFPYSFQAKSKDMRLLRLY